MHGLQVHPYYRSVWTISIPDPKWLRRMKFRLTLGVKWSIFDCVTWTGQHLISIELHMSTVTMPISRNGLNEVRGKISQTDCYDQRDRFRNNTKTIGELNRSRNVTAWREYCPLRISKRDYIFWDAPVAVVIRFPGTNDMDWRQKLLTKTPECFWKTVANYTEDYSQLLIKWSRSRFDRKYGKTKIFLIW